MLMMHDCMHRLDTWFTNIYTAFFIHYINIEMIINWILKFKQFIPNLFKTYTSSYLSLSRMIKKYINIYIYIFSIRCMLTSALMLKKYSQYFYNEFRQI